MNTVHSIFGDQPADVLRGAVDEVLDVIKNQNKTGVCCADSCVCMGTANSATYPACCSLSFSAGVGKDPLCSQPQLLCCAELAPTLVC